MKINLEKKIFIGFGVALFVLVAFVAISYGNTVQLIRSYRMLSHTQTTLNTLDAVLGTMSDAETAHRGFALTGEDNFLQPYQSAITLAGIHLNALGELTADNPKQLRLLALLRPLITAKLAFIADNVALRRTLGLDAARQGIVLGMGRQIMDKIRTIIAQMQAEEREQLKLHQTETRTNVGRMALVFFSLSLLALIATPIAFFAIRKDFRARRKAEQALATSEERFQLAARASRDVMWDWDLKTNAVWWNDNIRNAFGYAGIDVENDRQWWRKTIHRDDAARVGDSIQKFLEGDGRIWTGTYRFARGDGSYADIVDCGIVVRDHGHAPIRMIGSMTDVTERNRVGQALEAAARRERLLIANVLDMICSIDGEGRFVSVSPASLDILGYNPDELVGRKYTERVVLEDLPFTRQVVANILSGERTANFENRCLHKNDSEVNVMWSVTWSDEEQLMFCIAHDITERKRSDEKLHLFAKELQRSNEELQDFASIASHDLQEPLRKIQSFADELKTSLSGSLNEDDADTLERMIATATRMRRLINDLLSFSRLTTMAQPFVPVDLNVVVRDVLSDLEVRTRDSGGRVEASTLPVICADPSQMHQLFQNLIGNGLKFHHVDVPPIVRISATNGGPQWQLTVSDNGIGFDEKYVDRIFAIFQRLHGRNEYEGTGIGLTICRKIVERHGGTLTARSMPGHGATFTVTLPVTQAKEMSQ